MDGKDTIINRLSGNVTIPVQDFIDLVNSATANDSELEERYLNQINVILDESNKIKEDFRWFIDMFERLIQSTIENKIEEGNLIGDVINEILDPITIITPEKRIEIGTHSENTLTHKIIELK